MALPKQANAFRPAKEPQRLNIIFIIIWVRNTGSTHAVTGTIVVPS
jgi:hypothetical protein